MKKGVKQLALLQPTLQIPQKKNVYPVLQAVMLAPMILIVKNMIAPVELENTSKSKMLSWKN